MLKLQARSSATAHLVPTSLFPVVSKKLSLSELPMQGIIRLQGDPDNQKFTTNIEKILGIALPSAKQYVTESDVAVAWAGPREWLIFCNLSQEHTLHRRLSEEFSDEFVTATIMSDGRIAFLITGSAATDFLAQGCAIDLNDRVFNVGSVVTTRFAALPAMLIQPEQGHYVLYIDSASTAYALNWFLNAAREFTFL